jgi:hypothetical protein
MKVPGTWFISLISVGVFPGAAAIALFSLHLLFCNYLFFNKKEDGYKNKGFTCRET